MAIEISGRELWEPRVKEFQSSGQTQKDWSAAHGVKARTLGYWIKRLRDEENASDSPEWLKINTKSDSRIAAVSISSIEERKAYPEEFRVDVGRFSLFIPLNSDDASILRLLRLVSEI